MVATLVWSPAQNHVKKDFHQEIVIQHPPRPSPPRFLDSVGEGTPEDENGVQLSFRKDLLRRKQRRSLIVEEDRKPAATRREVLLVRRITKRRYAFKADIRQIPTHPVAASA